jgi:hypothetical protein
MADPSALSDLDDVLNGLGFDEKNPQNDEQQNSGPERRDSVLKSSGALDNPSRLVSTRINNRGNRQSNLFSTSAPLGHDSEGGSRMSMAIAAQSTRTSVVLNKTSDNPKENATADPLAEAGNRRSLYDPDHLELPDFKNRGSVSYDRPQTV